jgi:hypothetical protein
MKTVEEARRVGGPRRCSEEWRVAPTCPASQGRRGGEEGARPFEGGGARGWLSPVEAVGGVTWT